jgi:signal transduction histidine kinase
MSEVSEPRDARRVAEKLIAAIGAPSELMGHAVRLSASVGVCLYPDDGEDLDTLIARADAAMYQTKRQGAGGIVFHAAGSTRDPIRAAPTRRAVPELTRHGAAQVDALERQLSQSREANERLVLSALTAQELQAAAEQSLQRQTAFLAAVTDELHDPLAPIRIAASMLGLSPDQAPLLPRVQAIAERHKSDLSRLVGNLVAAVADDAQRVATDRRVVDLARVIDQAIATCQPMLARHGQRFESHRPPGVLEVQGDAAQLQQAIGNLLDNASRHTLDGGRISLSVDLRSEPRTVAVTVADDGIGITPEMLPQVFDPFVQDPQAFGLNGAGLGLGLTVARLLVQAHGGQLVAHSAGAGRGSQFVLTLPLAPSPSIAADAPPAGDGSAAGP